MSTVLEERVKEYRLGIIRAALEESKWRVALAAADLGVRRTWLYTLIHTNPALKEAWMNAKKRRKREKVPPE